MTGWVPDPELVERDFGQILESDDARPLGSCDCSECAVNVSTAVLTQAARTGLVVPREQVDELIAAVTAYEAWWDRDCDTVPYDAVQRRMASALARITQDKE